eukprot:6113236-Amphidinium_carterae.1
MAKSLMKVARHSCTETCHLFATIELTVSESVSSSDFCMHDDPLFHGRYAGRATIVILKPLPSNFFGRCPLDVIAPVWQPLYSHVLFSQTVLCSEVWSQVRAIPQIAPLMNFQSASKNRHWEQWEVKLDRPNDNSTNVWFWGIKKSNRPVKIMWDWEATISKMASHGYASSIVILWYRTCILIAARLAFGILHNMAVCL